MHRRSVLVVLALVALLAAAMPSLAAKKASGPTVTGFSPKNPELGDKVTISGRGFASKRKKNTVVLRAPSGATTFLKPLKASKRKLVVRLRATISRLMRRKAGKLVATRFRVRILSGKKFGPWTSKKRSLVIRPNGQGGAGGCGNATKDDDDNDLLSDKLEAEIKTDPCAIDTDGDNIEDGYEYESALNLNNDEDQEPNTSLPYPGKRPYPNPLDPSDAGKDFDGDSLLLSEEHGLWKYSIDNGFTQRTLNPLYYSDGEQYSINRRVQGDRRVPDLLADGYSKQIEFLTWASNNGYRTVMLSDGPPWYDHGTTRNPYSLIDMNRNGVEDAGTGGGYYYSETQYYDNQRVDGYLNDGERDEDADGLNNGDEAHRWMSADWWATFCYKNEKQFQIAYVGTEMLDPDSDGDGVRDGADDQDHDDIPNVMELSRNLASGLDDTKNGKECVQADNVGGSNFGVSGGPLPNTSIVVTFRNEFGGIDVPQMTASDTFTGGVAPAVSVTTIREGGNNIDEQQRVTVTGGPTGGSFELFFDGGSSGTLSFDADAPTVQGALETMAPADPESNHPNAYGRVNPFNPCLPARWSRSCPPVVGADTGAPFDGSINWLALN